MNLLVTGGAGFIGSHFIERVIDQPEIRVIVNLDCLTYAGHLANLKAVKDHPKYRFERLDLRDALSVMATVEKHQITHVVHLAAESHVDTSIARPANFISTNVNGTFHLLEACRATWSKTGSGRRFLHVSTDEVYGSLDAEGRFTERTPYAPNSPYSASKAAGDLLVRAYHHTYGLPSITTACCNNFGPRQFPEKLIPVVIQNLINRRPIPVYGDGLNVRDWLYVGDHCEALWTVLTRGRIGETYNIGGHQEWANLRLVERVCDTLDRMAPEYGGRSRELIQFVADRPGHDRRYAIDATKLQTELGWAPRHRFDAALQETVAWYLANQDWVREVQAGRSTAR